MVLFRTALSKRKKKGKERKKKKNFQFQFWRKETRHFTENSDFFFFAATLWKSSSEKNQTGSGVSILVFFIEKAKCWQISQICQISHKCTTSIWQFWSNQFGKRVTNVAEDLSNLSLVIVNVLQNFTTLSLAHCRSVGWL